MGTENTKLDLNAIRAKLKGADGQSYWRGLEELAESDDFTKWLDDEFPHRKSMLEVDRRSVLKLMGASLALAGLAGCRSLPQERVIPFTHEPENRPAGTTLYYASSFPFGGYGFPVLVESHEGRPTKLEGNPSHPASGGATDIFTQASILNLYDPDRIQDVSSQGLLDTWENFLKNIRAVLDKEKGNQGANIAILTGTITSPSLGGMLKKFQKSYPQATWCQYEPVNNDSEKLGTKLAFGETLQPIYDFSKAPCVLALDGDFLAGNPHTVQYARDFGSTRDLNGSLSRLYSVESTPSITGAFADHRLPVTPPDVMAIAQAVASAVGAAPAGAGLPKGVSQKWIDAVAADLQKGGIVYAGAHQTPEVHALAHAINAKVGAPVTYVQSAEVEPVAQTEALSNFCQDLLSSHKQLLIIIGGNPLYAAPGDTKFAEALTSCNNTVYFGEFGNETSKHCKWVVPEAHYLEAWGDVRSLDGTVSIVQPLIEPLFGAHSAIELIAALLKDERDGETIVRDQWKAAAPSQVAWEKILSDGYIPNTASPKKAVTVNLQPLSPGMTGKGPWAVFVPDVTVWDGSWTNNGWLQELPKPLTKLTWDNAVHMSPAMAEQLGVNFQDMVTVTAGDQSVTAVVFVQPGHPDNVVTLPMGYGRTEGGKVLAGTGFNFMPLRTTKNPSFAQVQLEKVAGNYSLSTAQLHHSMEGRDLIREGSLEEYKKNPTMEPEEVEGKGPTLYNLTEEWAADGKYAQWGMAIDLNLCVGCNACVTACQAENNIPTVGKVEVSRGRELHWIRIDRYYRIKEGPEVRDVGTGILPGGPNPKGWENPDQNGTSTNNTPDILDPAKIETVFQPVACMHCESAPCEPVCPVAATTHSHEGLNQMVYNRCVGTRYCSNNCPYKVRRFNFYNYQHGQRDIGLSKDYGNRNFQGEADVPLMRLLQNPDVTVRSRGVMEKCTYCVQRINEARITAKKEMRDIKDGEIVTACQQVCPMKAITFGNVADPASAVSKKKSEKRKYEILTELNTKPRTSYLARVRNPHPELENA